MLAALPTPVPAGNLALCILFASSAPTREMLVAQLAAEVVALRQPSVARAVSGNSVTR